MDSKEMYSIIKSNFNADTGETVSDDGDLGIRMQIVAGEIAALYNRAEMCSKQILPQTATGEYLAHHAQTRNIAKKRAANATGNIDFKRTTAASQNISIPIGTICTSSSGNSITYVTTMQKTLAAGSTSVSVPVQASVIGKTGNIAALKVDVLVSSLSGIESISNPEAISGGMEEENDESLRKRLLASYINTPNGANLKFYEQVAENIPAVWSAKAVLGGAASNEISLYITDMFRSTSNALCSEVQNAIELAREVGMHVTVKKPTIVQQNVSLKIKVRDLHDIDSQEIRICQYIDDRILSLGIGESFNPYSIAPDIGKQVDGFIDLAFVSPTALVPVSSSQVLSKGTITVEFVKNW